MTAIPPLRLYAATTVWQRLRGLHAWPCLPWHTGLVLSPCKGVHTIGLTYAIDVLFIDRNRRIVQCVNAVAPGRWAWNRHAVGVVELPAGYCAAYPAHAAAVQRALCAPAHGHPFSGFTMP